MRILVLYNPISGSGHAKAEAQSLQPALEAAGHEAVLEPTVAEPAADWLEAALAGVDLLLVVGGDGAVRLASRPAIRSDTPLTVYPLGTENLFSRELGIARSGPRLLESIRRFEVRRVDMGRVDGRDFLLMASLGPDAGAVADLASSRSGGIGHLSWTGPLLRQLFTWRAPTLTVHVDDETVVMEQRGMIFVANSRQYALRLDPALRASMTDGLLDAVFFPCRTAPAALSWMTLSRLRRHLTNPQVVYRTGKTITIESDPAHPYQLDGDPPGPTSPTTRLELTVEPATLPVLLP